MADAPDRTLTLLTIRQLLPLHLLATFLLAVAGSLAMNVIPQLATKRFGAGEWQSFLVTVALPTFMLTSILWNEWFRRMSLARYMLLQWGIGILPLALVALARSYSDLLILQAVAAFGAAGYTPFWGAVLKAFYPDRVRGRMFGILTIATLLGGIGTVYLAGQAMRQSDNGFRWLLPVLAAANTLGLLLVALLIRRSGMTAPSSGPQRPVGQLLRPILDMGAILREDPVFLRYQLAFMTYGFGFHICEAVFPLFVREGLHLEYEQIFNNGIGVAKLFTLLMVVPMGWAMDRLGPARTSAIAFACLALYPLALMLATDATGLAIASVFQGIAMGGVMQAWWIGPVTLAPSTAAVPSYVAIHTTLVGLRGILAQGLGVALYALTGRFEVSLIVAAVCCAAAAVQMWTLRGRLQRRPSRAARPAGAAETSESSLVSGAPKGTIKITDR